MPVPTVTYQSITISQLVQGEFQDWPKVQRDFVWLRRRSLMESLIDTMLRGLAIPAVTVLPGERGVFGGQRIWIVDGQQRIRTILAYYRDEFPTAKTFRGEPGVRPMFPGLRFSELSPSVQQEWLAYPLQSCILHSVAETDMALQYRRLQYQIPLTFAERLYSYSSKARDLAARLNAFVQSGVYAGDISRKQPFQFGITMLLLETRGGFSNCTTPRLVDAAHGTQDEVLSDAIIPRVEERIQAIEHLFDGLGFQSGIEIVPLYQTMWLLAEAGCAWSESKKGCLVPWYVGIRQEDSRRNLDHREERLLWKMNRVGWQQEFWRQNYQSLMSAEGLVFKDRRRAFNEAEKTSAWMRQHGICPVCDKPIPLRDGVGHHDKGYASGGETNVNNCVVVHKECHRRLGSSPRSILLPDL